MDFDQVAVNGVNSNGEDFGMSVITETGKIGKMELPAGLTLHILSSYVVHRLQALS